MSATRTQRRTAQMRETILEAAERLLAQRGAEALSPEAVAGVADVSIQTVYNRVGGKSAMLVAVAERALQENRRYMDAAYDGRGSAPERIQKAARAYVRFAFEQPHAFRVLAHPPNETEALKRLNELVAEQNAKLAAALRDGQSEGTIAMGLDPAVAATAVWAMFNGLLAVMLRPAGHGVDPAGVDVLLAQSMEILTGGLLARAEPGSRRSLARATAP